MQIDVFNGDADGICALIQLRLNQPVKSQCITGVKRDIELLQQVKAQAGDQIQVLDISFQKNQQDVARLLEDGAEIFYIDHHQPGEILEHPRLTTLINTDSNTCTSLLVNEHLQGKYAEWAIAAAFGDNLQATARETAFPLSLTDNQTTQLETLGVCINYNSYGSDLSDLHFAPDLLFQEMLPYASPFDFMNDNFTVYEKLLTGYSEDRAHAEKTVAEYETDTIAVFILPDQAWARRISGVFSNDLANAHPDRAHAVVSINSQKGYQISVRAPLNNKTGADELCASFPTGGGRKAAAGINHLDVNRLSEFITAFEDKYPS